MGQMQQVSKNNTAIMTEDGLTKIILHSTVVVSFNHEKVILNSGGWRTVTTRARMNQASNQFGLGFTVCQKNFDWFVCLADQVTVAFEDGMEIPL